jgi:membrane associated rhomboid family serine protease
MKLFRYFPANEDSANKELEKKIFRHSIFFPVLFIFMLWMVKLFEIVYSTRFTELGIYPLRLKGLKGIVTAPFIHGSVEHLISNTFPLLILTFALLFFYRKLAYKIFFLTYIISGLCVWIAAREAWHIGASGVIYGLGSFLLLSGIIRNDIRLLTVSIIVAFLYGSMFWGVFPIKPEISWEAHLWGGISGIILAVIYKNQGPPKLKSPIEDEDEDEDDGDTVNEEWRMTTSSSEALPNEE